MNAATAGFVFIFFPLPLQEAQLNRPPESVRPRKSALDRSSPVFFQEKKKEKSARRKRRSPDIRFDEFFQTTGRQVKGEPGFVLQKTPQRM